MAVVFEEQLKKNIADDINASVFMLFGDDGFLKKNYTDKISKKVAESDDIFNFNRFNGDSDLQEVYDCVLQFPVIADKKYVELCDFDFEHCSKADFEKLCTLITEVPETTVFVLRFDNLEFDIKKSSKFQQLLKQVEKAGGIACRLDHKRQGELVSMLIKGAAKRNCDLQRSSAEYLIELVGQDINLLRNELDKLCAFAEKGTINKEIIDLVTVKTVEASVYNLAKYIIGCNVKEALKCIDELFFMKIEPMAVFYSVSSVYVDMFRLFLAKQEGLKNEDVIKNFQYKGKEFLIDKASSNLKKFDSKRLTLSLNEIVAADRLLKTSGLEQRLILEQLIVRLIYIIDKGETFDKA